MKPRTAVIASAVLLASAYVSAKMNENKTPAQPSGPSIAERLVGTWKSECQAEAGGTSAISHVVYAPEGTVTTQDEVFASSDCTGASKQGQSETLSFRVTKDEGAKGEIRFFHDPATVATNRMVDALLAVSFSSDTEASFQILGATYKAPDGSVAAYAPETFADAPSVSFMRDSTR